MLIVGQEDRDMDYPPPEMHEAEKKWVRALFLLRFRPIDIGIVTHSGMFHPLTMEGKQNALQWLVKERVKIDIRGIHPHTVCNSRLVFLDGRGINPLCAT